MTRWRTRHRGSHAERGAAAVEFAIVLTVLLLFIFAIIDFGRLFFVVQSTKSASREAVRVGAITTATNSGIFSAASGSASAAAGLGGGTMYARVEYCSGTCSAWVIDPAWTQYRSTAPAGNTICATNGTIAIKVNVMIKPFRWFTPVGLFSSGISDVTQTSIMRCEGAPPPSGGGGGGGGGELPGGDDNNDHNEGHD